MIDLVESFPQKKRAEAQDAKSERGAGNSNLGQHPTSAFKILNTLYIVRFPDATKKSEKSLKSLGKESAKSPDIHKRKAEIYMVQEL